jgi:uncharacterized membrane protein
MCKLILLLSVLAAAAAFGGEGRDNIEFPSSNGAVAFDHRKHVRLVDGYCAACHTAKPGLIEGFDKAMAHRLCIGCHEPREGSLEGPLTCPGCHRGKH